MKKFNANAYANFHAVIGRYQLSITLESLEQIYNEPHRHFHTTQHLNEIMNKIASIDNAQELDISMYDELVLTTMYHDIVYYPWLNDNEEKSADFVLKTMARSPLRDRVFENVLQTKKHDGQTAVQLLFNKLDFGGLKDPAFTDIAKLIEAEHQIFKEYNFNDIDSYIDGRINFYKSITNGSPLIPQMIDYVKNRQYTVAIYPGSFNPFHIGHLNVLEKAEQLFDKVIILKGVNAEKAASIGTDAVNELKKQLPNREVISYAGNIIEKYFVGNKRNPVLIRGLRNGYDLVYEESYLTFCKDFHPELRYALILCDKEFSHVSSSSIRAVANSHVANKYTVQWYIKS
ncbi:MAG: adenylyltransferase/cytidyltransferase family protein [Candidatus Pacearchaeota archaeon]|jgi:pantetheine-phosphate adenylyltransferase|nr:adenylyltransferase/cytidyltransferase family protein [Clostridia bacterium]